MIVQLLSMFAKQISNSVYLQYMLSISAVSTLLEAEQRTF